MDVLLYEIGGIIGKIVVVVFFSSIALLLLTCASLHWEKNNKRWLVVFFMAAVLVAWYPFWGIFPGKLLAENICAETGGIHFYEKLPVGAEVVLFDQPSELNADRIVGLLVNHGFKAIEEQLPNNEPKAYIAKWKEAKISGTGLLSYRISERNDPNCVGLDYAANEDAFELHRKLYQYGLSYWQCLSVTEINQSYAPVVNKTFKQQKRFPINVEVTHSGYYNVKTGKPIAEKQAFYYVISEVKLGNIQPVNCHWLGPNSYPNKLYEPVVTGYKRNAPKLWQLPVKSYTIHDMHLEFGPIPDGSETEHKKKYDIQGRILGLGHRDVRMWQDAETANGTVDALVLNQEGVEQALALPPFSRPGIHFAPHSKPFEILSVFKYTDGYSVVRGDNRGEYWEIFSYSPQRNTLSREVVSLSDELKKYQGIAGADIFLTNVEKKQMQYVFSGYVKGFAFKLVMNSATKMI